VIAIGKRRERLWLGGSAAELTRCCAERGSGRRRLCEERLKCSFLSKESCINVSCELRRWMRAWRRWEFLEPS
jgi:hypothetical protein